MTLSSRHRIRNSSPGGLRPPSTLSLGHEGSPQYWLSHVDGEETFFVSFKPPGRRTEPRTLAGKSAVLTTTLGPPPTGPGEPPEDGEMTLSSRHRIRNSSPGGLRPSTLPHGHGGSPEYWLSHVDETFFVSFKPPRPGTEPRTLAWKAAVLSTTLGPRPPAMRHHNCLKINVQVLSCITWSYYLIGVGI